MSIIDLSEGFPVCGLRLSSMQLAGYLLRLGPPISDREPYNLSRRCTYVLLRCPCVYRYVLSLNLLSSWYVKIFVGLLVAYWGKVADSRDRLIGEFSPARTLYFTQHISWPRLCWISGQLFDICIVRVESVVLFAQYMVKGLRNAPLYTVVSSMCVGRLPKTSQF